MPKAEITICPHCSMQILRRHYHGGAQDFNLADDSVHMCRRINALRRKRRRDPAERAQEIHHAATLAGRQTFLGV